MIYLITWVISGVCGVLAVWSFCVHAMYVDLKFEIGYRALLYIWTLWRSRNADATSEIVEKSIT
jgi:hypothetical protein